MPSYFEAQATKSSYFTKTPKATGTIGTLEEHGYEVPKEKGWSLFGKKFLNTLTGVLDTLRTGEYAIGGMLAGKTPITGIREKISPSEILFKDREEDRKLWSKRGITALAVDILLDPITYLTFGAGGLMKLSTKGGQVLLSKSGQSLMKTMITKGTSEAAARRTMAKVIQIGGDEAAEKYIGKSGLKFMGEVFIPTSKFEAAGKVVGKIPGAAIAGKVGSGFARAFTPFRDIDKLPAKIGGKGTFTDFLYKPYERETRNQIFKEIDSVKKLSQKTYKDYGAEMGKELGYKVETGKLTGDDFLDTIVKSYNRDTKSMLAIERATGKEIGEVENYLRHYLTKDGRKLLDKTPNAFSGLSGSLKAKLAAATPRKIPGIITSINAEMSAKHGIKNFFEPDLFKSWAVRKVEHIKYINTHKFLEQTKVRFGVRMDKVVPRKIPTKAISKELESLTVEARKYKSAEEFVKKMYIEPSYDLTPGITKLTKQKTTGLYHGTNPEAIQGILNTGKIEAKVTKLDKIGQKSVSVTGSKGVAGSYGNIIFELDPKLRVIEPPAGAVKGTYYKGFEFRHIEDIPINKVKSAFVDIGTKESLETKIITGWKGREPIYRTIGEVKTQLEAKGIKTYVANFADKKGLQDLYTQAVKGVAKGIKRVPLRTGSFTNEGIRLVESTNPQLKGWLLPEPIVKHVDETMKCLVNEETMRGLLKYYDKGLAIWKKNVTGFWPAFHSRNFFGGSFNNWLAGVKVIDNVDTWKILQGSDDIIKTKIGTEYTGKQLLDLAERFGVRGQPGMMDVYRSVEEAIEEVTTRNLKKIGIKASNSPRWVMEQVEDRLRLPVFINRMKRGYSPAEAAKDVFKFHFDYVPQTGLTPFERTFMRRIIPFYVWTRNNVPLQIEMMMKQPGKYANLEKLRQSTIESYGKDEMQWLPDWMQEMFIAPLPFKDDAGRSLWMQLDLPLDDIKYLPISSSGIREIASTLTPFLKYPIERYMNRNFYFGGDIWNPELPREMQTRTATEALKILPSPIKKFINFREVKYRDWRFPKEKKFIKRYEIDAKKLHILQSFIGRYYSTLKGVYDKEIPTEWKASRFIGGIPVRSVDIPEEKRRRETEQERQAMEMLRYLQQHKLIPYKSEEKKSYF